MITLRGTAQGDRLAGQGRDGYKLIGLQGNDTYTLRLFSYEIVEGGNVGGVYVPPTIRTIYVQDDVVEAARGGYDTVKLVNNITYHSFPSVALGEPVRASELANIEHIVATTTVRGGRLIGWNITADDGDNLIDAPRSADTLAGGKGDDRINGGGGNDTLLGGAGHDTLNGGSGTDTASYAGDRSAVVFDLGAGTSSAQDRLISIESAIGTSRSDRLYGSGADNTLNGGGGNDRLSGNGGGDTLLGGKGNDTLNGGSGDDVLSSGGGTDQLTGGSGRDRFEFAFDANHGLRDNIYIYYYRTISFQDTITDFEDGKDKIVIHQATAEAAGVGSNAQGPGPNDIYVRQAGADTIVYFGSPDNGGNQSALHDLYYGSVVLKHFDADRLSTADFLFL